MTGLLGVFAYGRCVGTKCTACGGISNPKGGFYAGEMSDQAASRGCFSHACAIGVCPTTPSTDDAGSLEMIRPSASTISFDCAGDIECAALTPYGQRSNHARSSPAFCGVGVNSGMSSGVP